VQDGKVRLQIASGEVDFDLVNVDKARLVPSFGLTKSSDGLV
jgi:hypothetical protein